MLVPTYKTYVIQLTIILLMLIRFNLTGWLQGKSVVMNGE